MSNGHVLDTHKLQGRQSVLPLPSSSVAAFTAVLGRDGKED